MTDENLLIEYHQINDLKPYEKNARKHTKKDLKTIVESIQEFGFNDPIGIWGKDNLIVEGHGRLMAAKEIGMVEVPCIRLDHLDDEQRRAYALAHNKTAEMSDWDFDMLEKELKDIQGINMENFGFDIPDIENEVTDDEYMAPEEDPEPNAKYGQIYQLGNHRLMCGDSTKKSDIEKLAAGATMDLLVTDPPYNVNYEGQTKDHLKIMNDNMDDAKFRAFLIDAFKSADSILNEGAPIYVWHADSEGLNFRASCKEVGWKMTQCLIWNKNSLVLGHADYQWKHEPCLYGWKPGKGHYFIDDRTNATILEENLPNYKEMTKQQLIKLLDGIFENFPHITVMDEKKPKAGDIHPTMKPMSLISKQIVNSSVKGQNVLDIFGGSGTTLMCCEQLERTCYTMELDPRYVDAIINRWEEYTGEKAVLLEG